MSISLDLFSVPKTDLTILAWREVEQRPLNVAGFPIIFEFNPSANYTAMDLCRFTMRFRLHLPGVANGIQAQGQVSDDDNTRNVWFVPNAIHSMIRDVRIEVNDMVYTPNSDTYAWKAFFQKISGNYSERELQTTFRKEGAILDAMNIPDLGLPVGADSDVPPNRPAVGAGVTEDINHLRGAGEYYVEFMPLDGFFHQERLIVPETKIRISFTFNQPEFFLMTIPGRGANANHKVLPQLRAEDIHMTFKQVFVTINPNTMKALKDRRNKHVAVQYPVVNWGIKTYNFAGNTREWLQEDPFNNRLPNTVFVGVLLTTAYQGNWRQNPFGFKRNHGGWSIISVKQFVDGEEYPIRNYTLDADGNVDSEKQYQKLCQAFGCFSEKKGAIPLPTDWGHGRHMNLFAFNNHPDANPNRSTHKTVEQTGEKLRYEILFNQAPGENLTIMFFAEHENTMQIDAIGGTKYDIIPY